MINKFELSKTFLDNYRNLEPNWGFGSLSKFVYQRTYSRLKEDGTQETFFDTIKRCVEGSFNIQLKHCKNSQLPWDARKAQKSAQIMFEKMWNFKFLPPGRGMWVMGTPIIDKLGGTPLLNCFAAETEVITSEGIKQISELQGTEPVLLTEGGKWIKAPVKAFGSQELYKITLSRSGLRKEIFATADHGWFAKDRRQEYRNKGYSRFTTVELRPGIHRLQYCFGQGVKDITPSTFGIAHGITYGDGNLSSASLRATAGVTLCGEKNLQLLDYFNNCEQQKAAENIRVVGLPNYFKEFPSLNENKSYLYGFLSGYFAADGTVDKSGSCSIESTDENNILKVRELCAVLGIPTYGPSKEDRISNLTNKPSTLWTIVLHRNALTEDFFLIDSHKERFLNNPEVKLQYWTVISVEKTTRKEIVYCATVPGYHKFTLADNILTSNCGFISTKDIDKDFAEPFAWACDMLMLGVGIGYDTLGAGKVIIRGREWYSTEVIKDVKYQIPDTREGWVEALRLLLDSFTTKDIPYTLELDYSLIRPAGVPIKGFGGTASGPEPLRQGLDSIRELLKTYVGKPLDSVGIVDIMNYIGKFVVAGNVRRSAEIAIGNITDTSFIEMKDYKKYPTELTDRRWMCITGDSIIDTSLGLRRIDTLLDSSFEVILDGKYYSIGGIKKTGTKKVLEIKTKAGPSIKTSYDHRLMTSNGWKRADELSLEDVIKISNNKTINVSVNSDDYKKGYLIGHLIGDGTYTSTTTTGEDIARLQVYTKDPGYEDVKNYIASIFNFETRSDFNGFSGPYPSSHGDGEWFFISCKKFTELAASYGIKKGSKVITNQILSQSHDFLSGLSAALFDTDGWVIKDRKTLAIEMADENLLNKLQLILLRLGIPSRINKVKEDRQCIIHGKSFNCGPAWRLVISGYDSANLFLNKCYIRNIRKWQEFEQLDKPIRTFEFTGYSIESITEIGEQEVYDINVPEVNSFTANGLYVHNSNNSVVATPTSDFSTIIDNIALNGEPGLIFLDTSRKYGRIKDGPREVTHYKYDSVDGYNPSLRGNTLVLTDNGILPISKIANDFPSSLKVRNFKGEWAPCYAFKSGTDKQLYKIRFSSGHEVFCTPEHKWPIISKNQNYTRDEKENINYSQFSKLRTDELSGNELVYFPHNTSPLHDNSSNYSLEDAFMLGWWLGDGWTTHRFKESRYQIGCIVSEKDSTNGIKEVVQNYIRKISKDDTISGLVRDGHTEYNISNKNYVDKMLSMGALSKTDGIPSLVWKESNSFVKSFIDGLYSSDGCVSNYVKAGKKVYEITLSSSRLKIVEDIKKLLAFFGISVRINKTKTVLNGKEFDRYDSKITGQNIIRFCNAFTLTHVDKQKRLAEASKFITENSERYKNEYLRIDSITLTNIVEDVYDITVNDDTHTFLMETGVTGNCAEQSLKSFECCVSGNTRILTKTGYPEIKTVIGEEVEIWNGESWKKVKPFQASKNAEPMFRVHISDGSYLDCTRGHEWSVKPETKRLFRKVTTSQLNIGDTIQSFEVTTPYEGILNTNAFELGLFTGDGYIDSNYPMLIICGEKEQLEIKGTWYKPKVNQFGTTEYRVNLKSSLGEISPLLSQLRDYDQGLPEDIFKLNKESILEFVAGWIETDGSVQRQSDTDSYRIYGTEHKLRDLQLLLRKVGINHASINLFAEKGSETNLGIRNYNLYYLQIPSFECGEIPTRLKKCKNIGSRYKTNNAYPNGNKIDVARKQKIIKIEQIEDQISYCFTEPELHMGVFGNVLTYQCNLVETFPANHETVEEFWDTLKYAYLYAKSVTLLHTHCEKTNQIMLQNRRIGCSQSGIQQAIKKFGIQKYLNEFCNKSYAIIDNWDHIYSRWLGIPTSIKMTTVKPSGTISLLAGATPGVHCTHSEYYMRTIRIAANSPLLPKLIEANYKIEESITDKNTMVVYFPVKEKNFTKSKYDISLWEQLTLVKELQYYWSDNAVSCTVTFKPNEVKDLQSAIEYFAPYVKTLSFLPLDNHNYPQAPYQTCTEQEYIDYLNSLGELDFSTQRTEAKGEKYCTNDSCTL